MKLFSPLAALAMLSLLLTSCASRYRAIYPTTLEYSAKTTQEGVELGYRYAVLEELGNRKYAKKERRTGVKVVALKITNNTSRDLILGKNMKLMSGTSEVPVLTTNTVVSSLKQPAPAYLLYLLLSF